MNGLRPLLGSKSRVIPDRWQRRAFRVRRGPPPAIRKAALFALMSSLGVACSGPPATAPASSATASTPAASPAAGSAGKAAAAPPAKVAHAPKAPIALEEY